MFHDQYFDRLIEEKSHGSHFKKVSLIKDLVVVDESRSRCFIK